MVKIHDMIVECISLKAARVCLLFASLLFLAALLALSNHHGVFALAAILALAASIFAAGSVRFIAVLLFLASLVAIYM